MAEVDFRILTLLRMFKYKNNPEKIREDNGDLYKLVNEYLEQNGASSEFLEKPAVIERVKKIIFSNLMLGKNTKFAENGMIFEKGENYSQTLGVLKNGSILFVRDYDKQRRITTFDLMNDEVVCRYMEYSEKGYLVKEKRVLIDEFGFDRECEDTFFELEKKYREKFNTIISSVTPVSIMAIEDNGSASITENLDNYFLNRKLMDSISDDILDENLIDNINFDDMNEYYVSYPRALEVEDTVSIYEIKRNFGYLRDRYPNIEQWYINRFGKEFTQKLGELKDESLTETSELEKILEASESEIFIHFQNEDLDNNKITSYIKELYEKKKYFCAYIFLQKMTDSEIINFIKDNSELDPAFLSVVTTFISDDKTKVEFLASAETFSILEKVQIVESLKSEDQKVEFYDENIDEILEYDKNLLEMEEEALELEDYENSNNEYVSQKVLDSLSKKENLYRFLMRLRDYCKIKYEYIKEFSLEEINDVIGDRQNCLEAEEYAAILRTRKLDDEDIMDFLNENWEDGLDLSRNDEEIKVDGDVTYSLKVFALLCMKDEDEKADFLKKHKDDYGADEITEVLKDFGDSERILTLAKEFNLPKHYYYDLVILCSDDDKFKCLQDEEDMSEEDVSIIISAIEDMPKAFKYVAGLQEFNAMQKVRILSRIETEFYEDPDVMKKIKLKFLKDNKDEIIRNVESSEDLEFFSTYISDYGLDADQEEVIEEIKEKFEEYDEAAK